MADIFETERLWVLALTLEDLILLKNDLAGFEKRLDVVYDGEPLEGFILEMLDNQIRIITEDSGARFYYAFWMLKRKVDKKIVGSMAYKGYPNEKGEVEIGYGLNPKYWHQGYMTEAIVPAVEWALKQKGVSCVIAETELTDIGRSSRKLLYRNGFFRYRFGKTSWLRRRPEGNPYMDEIIYMTNRALWETENLIQAVPEEMYEARYDAIPVWKYIYHMLYSMDRWYVNPADASYESPSFHKNGLNDLNVIPTREESLSKEQLLEYYYHVAEKITEYLSTATDADLLTYPAGCKYNHFKLILGQIRHWHRHMGIVYGFVIKDAGKWPYVLNMENAYPRDEMPNFYE